MSVTNFLLNRLHTDKADHQFVVFSIFGIRQHELPIHIGYSTESCTLDDNRSSNDRFTRIIFDNSGNRSAFGISVNR